jgi:hypothetical protein
MDDIILQFEKLISLNKDTNDFIDPIGDFNYTNAINMDEIVNEERLESQDRVIIEINNKFKVNKEITEIKNNYSKLKYFRNLSLQLDFYFFEKYFMYPFLELMKKLDEVNKYYIDNIIISSELYIKNDIINLIYNNINNSLQTEDPSIKLDAIIIAYKNILILFEEENKGEIIDPSHERLIITKRRKKI